MTTQEVANRLVELCRKGEYHTAHQELYADHVVSIEPDGAQGPARVEGIQGINAKAEQYVAMVEEMHANEVSDPIVAGNHFSVSMKSDATFKGMGRQQMEEVCIYEVENGKVVKEQFFYPVQPQG